MTHLAAHETKPTLVVMGGDDKVAVDMLAIEIGAKLAGDMKRLTGKFSAKHYQAFITGGEDMKVEEILASADDVLNRHNLMILTGYRDTEIWNKALEEIAHHFSPSMSLLLLNHEEGAQK